MGRFVAHNPKMQQDWHVVLLHSNITPIPANIHNMPNAMSIFRQNNAESNVFIERVKLAREWCQEHAVGRWTCGRERVAPDTPTKSTRILDVFRFKNKDDALRFKLSCG